MNRREWTLLILCLLALLGLTFLIWWSGYSYADRQVSIGLGYAIAALSLPSFALMYLLTKRCERTHSRLLSGLIVLWTPVTALLATLLAMQIGVVPPFQSLIMPMLGASLGKQMAKAPTVELED